MFDEIKKWAKRSYVRTRELGLPGARHSMYLLYRGLWRGSKKIPIGTNIYEREWDALVILDACRLDVMHEVAPKFDYIDDVDAIWSTGSTSAEWLQRTFTDEYSTKIKSTAYVSANPFTSTALTQSPPFEEIEEVWRDGFDSEMGTVPPREVTNRAIHTGRSLNPEYLIIHYMQPHHPFVAENATLSDISSISDIIEKKQGTDWEWSPGDIHKHNVWLKYGRGEISYNDLWTSYRLTLEMVLEELQVLLSNLTAETVIITADHGNAIGEWGMYGHPTGFLHPAVKKVPWIETTATDNKTYEPDTRTQSQNQDVEKVLESLGYL